MRTPITIFQFLLLISLSLAAFAADLVQGRFFPNENPWEEAMVIRNLGRALPFARALPKGPPPCEPYCSRFPVIDEAIPNLSSSRTEAPRNGRVAPFTLHTQRGPAPSQPFHSSHSIGFRETPPSTPDILPSSWKDSTVNGRVSPSPRGQLSKSFFSTHSIIPESSPLGGLSCSSKESEVTGRVSPSPPPRPKGPPSRPSVLTHPINHELPLSPIISSSLWKELTVNRRVLPSPTLPPKGPPPTLVFACRSVIREQLPFLDILSSSWKDSIINGRVSPSPSPRPKGPPSRPHFSTHPINHELPPSPIISSSSRKEPMMNRIVAPSTPREAPSHLLLFPSIINNPQSRAPFVSSS